MAWVVSPPPQRTTSFALYSGYLDNLSRELRQEPSEDKEDEYDDQRRQSMNLDEEQVDRFGVGSWDSYVDFSEFDGGDGQMGVAGDGKEGLDKEWEDNKSAVMKSRSMSAKVAWGANTGYAEELRAKGVETSRAQQMENWMNQQELQKMRHDQRYMTEEFDSTTSKDEDWRKLASFGVERNQDFDLDETFGAVTPGTTIYHHIQLNTRINRAEVFEFNLLVRYRKQTNKQKKITEKENVPFVIACRLSLFFLLTFLFSVSFLSLSLHIYIYHIYRTRLWDIQIFGHALHQKHPPMNGLSNLVKEV